MATDNDKAVRDIIERYDESRKWMSANIYPRWEDVYRSYKVLVKPVYKRDADGKETKEEDDTRTNVCTPLTSLMVRRNTARLTASPPAINYRCSNPDVAAKLSAWSFMQYDRSGDARDHRKVVMQGELIGWSVSKLSWNTVELMRQFRRDAEQFKNRAEILKGYNKSDEEIDAANQNAVSTWGSDYSEEMHPEELAGLISEYGPEVKIGNRVKKYEGPVCKFIFAGDFFFEPEVASLDNSAWAIETYTESDIWVAKQVRKTYKDEKGQDVPVFDEKAARELLDTKPSKNDEKDDDLRRRFRMIVGQSDANIDSRLIPGKRFKIHESHEIGDDGRMWIKWVGNDKISLGKMPYPWDLYGKYTYTEYAPIPDLVSNLGDSTPMLLRYYQALHNANMGQRTDLVNAALRRKVIIGEGADIPEEEYRRGSYDVLKVKDPRIAQNVLQNPEVPASAWEQEQSLLMVIGMAEPSLNNVESGTKASPQPGKTATTAILQSKAADALTQFKLDSLNLYLKDIGEKKLWMLQQEMREPVEVPKRYFKDDKAFAGIAAKQAQYDVQQQFQDTPEEEMPSTDEMQMAISEKYGQASVIRIDPLEIQEDIEVEPVAMSMLGVDDELNRQSALDFWQLASSRPDIFNVKYAAERVVSTVRGVDLSKAFAEAPSGPPTPETRMNISVSIPFDKLPSDVQNPLLEKFGMEPSKELEARDTARGMVELGHAVNAADQMLSPASDQMPQQPQVKPKPKGVPNVG